MYPKMSCASIFYIPPRHLASAIFRMLPSNHYLRMETGRWGRPYMPQSERTCLCCGDIENGAHALFDWFQYKSHRESFIRSVGLTISGETELRDALREVLRNSLQITQGINNHRDLYAAATFFPAVLKQCRDACTAKKVTAVWYLYGFN